MTAWARWARMMAEISRRNVTGFLAAAMMLAVFVLCAVNPAAAQETAMPSEASLIAAWEDIQKNDSKTVTFEKTGEGTYRFATERFPYEGGLNVLNITIEPLSGSVMGESYYGVIEVELTDLPEDFFRKYAYSYSAWQKNNYLYYNAEDASWGTSTQWSETLAEEYDSGHVYGYGAYQSVFWLGALVVLLIVVLLGLRQIRKAMAQQQTALAGQDKALEMMAQSQEMARESLKIQKENTKILKAILKALEGGAHK